MNKPESDDSIESNINSSIQEYYLYYQNLIWQTVFSTIFIISQQQIIPLIQGNLIINFKEFYSILILYCLSFVIISTIFFNRLQQINTNSDKLNRVNRISKKIIPTFSNFQKEYSFYNFLNCQNDFDILKCQASNPKQFLDDYLYCIKYIIYKNIDFVPQNERNEFLKDIPQDIIYVLSKIDDLRLKDIIENIKKIQIEDIIYENYKINGIIIDYQQFLNRINKIKLTYLEIKIKNMKQSGNHQLRKFTNIANQNKINLPQSFKINQSFYIKNENFKTQFETTSLCQLSNEIQHNQTYDIDTDSVISELYYNSLSKECQSTQKIHNIIEEYEHILINECNGEQQGKMKIKNKDININLKQAKDKEINNIKHKISRKNKSFTEENVPWCVKLIKDFKRMSIIFKDENEIRLQIENKKNLFGSHFEKQICTKDQNIFIRISEIKNGFYGLDSHTEDGDQRDLKIIQEIAINNEDTSFMLECQLNLDSLIKQKKSDHIIQDFSRAETDQLLIKKQEEENMWMEGKLRPILETIRIVLLVLAISAIGIATGYILNDFNIKFDIIKHANKLIKFNFIEGLQKDNICYSIDNNNYHCIGDTKINYLLQKVENKKLRMLKSNGESLIGIDFNNNSFLLNFEKYERFTQYSDLSSIQQNNFIICQHSKSKLHCNHLNFYPKSIDIFEQGLCVSVRNLFKCVGNNYQGSNDIPSLFAKGVSILSSGYDFNCASIPGTFLCWGSNYQGTLNFPDAFSEGVDRVTAAVYHACASKGSHVECWGNDTQNIHEIPDWIDNGCVLLDSFQLARCCVDSLQKIQCWGINGWGQLSIPPSAKDGVTLLSVGLYNICNQNQTVHCWGSDNVGIINQLPNFQYPVNLLSIKNFACTSDDHELKCWGSLKPDISDFFSDGVDLLAVGDFHLCVTLEVYIQCFGDDFYTSDLNFPLDIKSNQQYPSIQESIKSISLGTSMKCIQKDMLQTEKEGLATELPRSALYSSDFKASWDNACSNQNGKLKCWGGNEHINDVPQNFEGLTSLQTLNENYACAQRPPEFLKCWTSPGFQTMIDIPNVPLKNLTILVSGMQNVCIGNSYFLVCWGGTQEVNLIPTILQTGASSVGLGQFFGCASKDNQLVCWGMNTAGELDIPESFTSSIDNFQTGNFHVCGLNSDQFICWGQNDKGQTSIPNHLKNGVDLLTVNNSSNCGMDKDEWFCWGEGSINFMYKVKDYMQFNDVNNYAMTYDQEFCVEYTGQVQCQSNLGNSGEQSINIQESMMCMQVLSGRTQLCQADGKNNNKFVCFDIQDSFGSDQIKYEQSSKSPITKVSCGTNHGCVLYENGEVHCFGGSIQQNEADLPNEMLHGVMDIRAGHHSTCIINTLKILCIGNEIETNIEQQSLLSINGFHHFINI